MLKFVENKMILKKENLFPWTQGNSSLLFWHMFFNLFWHIYICTWLLHFYKINFIQYISIWHIKVNDFMYLDM